MTALLVACLLGNTFFSSHIIPEVTNEGLDLHVTNILGYEVDKKICTFYIDGQPVTLIWHSKPGRKDDIVTIIPPPNYFSIPGELIIKDGDKKIIQIRPFLLGALTSYNYA